MGLLGLALSPFLARPCPQAAPHSARIRKEIKIGDKDFDLDLSVTKQSAYSYLDFMNLIPASITSRQILSISW